MKLKIFGRLFIVVLMVYSQASFAQKSTSVALTPPMGWNSWNCFDDERISAEKVMGIADAMVSSGMKDAGYEYVVIDDGWATNTRDKDGHIIVDSIKFPDGIKPVADYVHSLGLKFGIYSSPGCLTCAGNVGSFGYEQIDADDFASWGVDFLKYDWCRYTQPGKNPEETEKEDCRPVYELMSDCLAKTGRPIVFSMADNVSILPGGIDASFPWVFPVGHMQSTSGLGGDIKNDWNRMMRCLESTANLWQYARPGFWNDPDMLEVGNEEKEYLWGEMKIKGIKKMNLTEYRTHFSMWCMVAAPLLAGNDLRTMKPEIIDILTNKEMIAIDQDPLGKQGRRVRQLADDDLEVWVKELSGNRRAVALLNRSSVPADINVKWEEIGMNGKRKVRDLWQHEDLGKFKDSFTGKNIASHEAVVLLVE